ncbi:MAG TPA: glycerophosphodiester phosphodiesterase [Acidimicrobiales bacterium]|nr:glycerophosphodiester phosphodiesterase [Acidimicrobiales bacterium]
MRARSALLVAALLVAGCSGDDDAPDGSSATSAPTTSVAPAEPPAAFGEATEPVVVGHRGAAGHFPDNTLEAFAGAAELGADWVELDVRLSSDGQAVLSHDPETEDGTVVATTTAAELGLPTLLEALEVVDEHGLGVDVEIKSDPSEATYDPSLAVVEEAMANLIARPIEGPIVVTSFDRAAVDRARELTDDRFPTALIAGGIGDAAQLRTDLLDAGHEGVVLNHEAADAELVHTLSTGGLTLWVYTLDDPTRAAALVGLGVEGIVTDLPDVISERLDLLR